MLSNEQIKTLNKISDYLKRCSEYVKERGEKYNLSIETEAEILDDKLQEIIDWEQMIVDSYEKSLKK